MDFIKGQLVRSRAGRDSTRTYAVLYVQDEYLLLVNGESRNAERPKKKKKRHVNATKTVLEGTVLSDNEALSRAIQAYDAQSPI